MVRLALILNVELHGLTGRERDGIRAELEFREYDGNLLSAMIGPTLPQALATLPAQER